MNLYDFFNSLEYLDNRYVNTDTYLDYIDQLRHIHIDLRRVPLSQIDQALYEAIFLFDKLNQMSQSYFQCYIHNGVQSILSIYDYFDNLISFEDNAITRDIFFAQFQYFITKYLLHYFNKEIVPSHKGILLSLRIRNCIVTYIHHPSLIQDNIYKTNQDIYRFISHISN